MIQGIMVFSSESSVVSSWQRINKVRLHWGLMLSALLFGLLGLLAIIRNKVRKRLYVEVPREACCENAVSFPVGYPTFSTCFRVILLSFCFKINSPRFSLLQLLPFCVSSVSRNLTVCVLFAVYFLTLQMHVGSREMQLQDGVPSFPGPERVPALHLLAWASGTRHGHLRRGAVLCWSAATLPEVCVPFQLQPVLPLPVTSICIHFNIG